MQKENRFLDFAEQVIARHRGLGFGFEPAAMLHLEEQGQEQSEQSPVNQNFITNLYHIQNIKEENYLFKQNLSFLTQVLENKMYQKLYPSVEKQIEKVIREEMPESEAKIIRSVSEQLVRLVQEGGIRQYEILKEKVLSEYNETLNTTWTKQETMLRKIENIWNSSVYHRSETKKEEHTEQKVHVANHYTTLSQNSKVTANLQFPVRELVEKYDSNAVKMLPQTIDAIKSGTESSSVETKEIVLKQLLNQITKQMNFVTTAKSAPNYESISLEYIQEAQNPELEVQHSLQVQQLLQSKVQKQVEQQLQSEVQKQVEQQLQSEVQKQIEQHTQIEMQKQVEQHTQKEMQKQVEQHTQKEIQKQIEQSAPKERQPIQEATVKYTPEFYERTRKLQEQIVNIKEAEQPKVARLESVSLEYMQEESAKETADAQLQSEVQKQIEQHTQIEMQKQVEQHVQSEVQKQVEQHVQSEVQKQVEQHTQREVQKQVEQSVQKETQTIQEATVKYTPEFYERTRELQEQIINYKESEPPKVARLESVSLEYMQEESAKETADAQMQSEVQKQVEQHTKSEVQKQVEQHTQREVQKQVEQFVQKERQPIQETTVKYTPEFYERTRELQEQIINDKESEQPKVARLESVSLEYMQEESAKETADAHKQSEVQKLAEQHKQSEVQKLVEQHTQKEIQKQVEQYIQREVQQQKEQPAQIEKKPIQETTVKYIPEFFEKKKELQEQIINYQETEKTKTAKIESVSLEYMQEESVQEKVRELESEIGRQTIEKYVSYENQFRKNLINKKTFVQNLLQGNKEGFRSGKAEPLSLEYPTEETSQLHHQMVQMVQSEIQSIPQIPKIISSKDVSEQILLRMESLGLVPVTQMKTAAKTVASYQLSKVLLEHVDSEMTTEELQESMIHILQNYRTEAIKQTSVSKAFSPMVKMTKLQSKVPEFVQQMEPAPIYYRSEDQLSQEQQEKNKNLEKKVQDVVKNLKTIEEKTIVHQERIIEQQREVVHEVLKNHSKDLFLDKESTTFIRGEVQQSVEEQMSQNVGKIADKVYRQLESRLKSERGRRGLI